MAIVTVYNRETGSQYTIDVTVMHNVIKSTAHYQHFSGANQYYIRVSTAQRGVIPGDIGGATVPIPAEIILELKAPDFDVTEEIQKRCVIIMDKVTGGLLLSTSSSSISSSSSQSSQSSSSQSSQSSSSFSSESSESSGSSESSASSVSSLSSESSDSSSSSSDSSESSSSDSSESSSSDSSESSSVLPDEP